MRNSVVAMLLILLGLPSAADAAVRYVDGASGADDANDCLADGSPCRTIGRAVEVASDGVDEIRIAAGSYGEPVETEKRLTFVGVGGGWEGSATVVAPTVPGAEAFVLPRGGALRSLRAHGAAGTDWEGGHGIWAEPVVDGRYALELHDVYSYGGRSASGALYSPGGLVAVSQSDDRRIDVAMVGGAFVGGHGSGALSGEGALVDGPGSLIANGTAFHSGGDPGSAGLDVSNGAAVDVRSSSMSARAAGASALVVGNAVARVARSTLRGTRYGVLTRGDEGKATASISNSLVVAAGGNGVASDTVVGAAASIGVGSVGEASLTATGSTFAADGPSADGAVLAQTMQGAKTAIVLRNSIAHVTGSAKPLAADLVANGGTVSAASSSYTTTWQTDGGSVTPVGTAGNVNGNPLFNPTSAFSLLSSSPLIDRGDPGFVAPGELALNDAPRALDGNGDCLELPDIGAYELGVSRRSCPVSRPAHPFSLSQVTLSPRRFTVRKPTRRRRTRGTTLTFLLSSPADVSVLVERRSQGRRARVGGERRCVKERPKNRRAARCVRHVKTGTLKLSGRPGRNKRRFFGRVGRRLLRPGLYRMSLIATDAAGAKSRTVRRSFRVLAP